VEAEESFFVGGFLCRASVLEVLQSFCPRSRFSDFFHWLQPARLQVWGELAPRLGSILCVLVF
jgi:hypothetical protein